MYVQGVSRGGVFTEYPVLLLCRGRRAACAVPARSSVYAMQDNILF